MGKYNSKLKIFLGLIVFVFSFSILFLSAGKALAQQQDTADQIVVDTTGYSILSPNSFVFSGDYYGNYSKKGFTTYFEFKKDDSNLDDSNNREETIKIVRPTSLKPTVEESGNFYTGPELKIFSTYYFRAVGYYNDTPLQKFYGQTLSLQTGYFPNGTMISGDTLLPISVAPIYDRSNPSVSIVTSYQTMTYDIPSSCGFLGNVLNQICESKMKVVTCNPNQTLVNGVCVDNNNQNNNGSGNNKNNSGSNNGSGLVPCDGPDCGFPQILMLIQNVLNFLLKYLALPLAAIMFAYAGFELITSGGETEKRNKAKRIFINVAIGLFFIAGAFLIVKTILGIAGYVQTGWDWFGF